MQDNIVCVATVMFTQHDIGLRRTAIFPSANLNMLNYKYVVLLCSLRIFMYVQCLCYIQCHVVHTYSTCTKYVHTCIICSFAVSVIGRLVTLIYQRAHLEAEVTAIRRQAEQANRELQRRLQEDEDKKVNACCCMHIYMYTNTIHE